jgi:hypothetical protein
VYTITFFDSWICNRQNNASTKNTELNELGIRFVEKYKKYVEQIKIRDASSPICDPIIFLPIKNIVNTVQIITDGRTTNRLE